MWIPTRSQHRRTWSPNSWCAAKLRLCNAFEREDTEEIVRFPEQWIYFLWRPTERSVPFRWPDCYGLTCGDPSDEIARNTNYARIYFVEEDESDWSLMLRIPLRCSRLEPWLFELLNVAAERKDRETRARISELYANDGWDFQRFLQASCANVRVPDHGTETK